jgi:hypothetical protein
MSTSWELLETPKLLQADYEQEVQDRLREAEAKRRHQETPPTDAIVSTWRRLLLRLEKQSESQFWRQQLQDWKSSAVPPPSLCKHEDIMLLRNSANKWASQTFCQQCEKIVIYDHSKEGIVVWMRKHVELVKRQISPQIADPLFPSDDKAATLCMRCAHPMIKSSQVKGKVWHQCSQHNAKEPCRYITNGYLLYALLKKVEKATPHTPPERWFSPDKTVMIQGKPISGTTVIEIGKTHKGRSYGCVFQTFPVYVDWVITAVNANQQSNEGLKKMASYFKEAQKCQAYYGALQNQGAASSSTPSNPSQQETTAAMQNISEKAYEEGIQAGRQKAKQKKQKALVYNLSSDISDMSDVEGM